MVAISCDNIDQFCGEGVDGTPLETLLTTSLALSSVRSHLWKIKSDSWPTDQYSRPLIKVCWQDRPGGYPYELNQEELDKTLYSNKEYETFREVVQKRIEASWLKAQCEDGVIPYSKHIATPGAPVWMWDELTQSCYPASSGSDFKPWPVCDDSNDQHIRIRTPISAGGAYSAIGNDLMERKNETNKESKKIDKGEIVQIPISLKDGPFEACGKRDVAYQDAKAALDFIQRWQKAFPSIDLSDQIAAAEATRDSTFSFVKDCWAELAIHEFGHALGFTHSQRREDMEEYVDEILSSGRLPDGSRLSESDRETYQKCKERLEGEPRGTAGDIHFEEPDMDSVMNYCNPKSNGDGILSEKDKRHLRWIYFPEYYPTVACSEDDLITDLSVFGDTPRPESEGRDDIQDGLNDGFSDGGDHGDLGPQDRVLIE